MKALRWFQTKVGLFQDPRMMFLLNQPHGDSYFVIWFYLKDLAGMINDDGYIYVSERQAMPTELLARQLRRRKAFVERVLDVFEQIDLISRDETGLIRIVPWDEIQSFSRDEKKRSDARNRMRRYRQRQREEQANTAACASHNEMTGRMPVERLQSVNGQACEPGYTVPYGEGVLKCQHGEQVSRMLDEKIQDINEPLLETEPAASYSRVATGYRRNGMKTVAVPDKRIQRVNGQTHQTGYTAPSGKAELDCGHYGEQISHMLDEKIQNGNEPLPETEPTALYGGTVADYPQNGMKASAVTNKRTQHVNEQTHQTGYAAPYGEAELDCVRYGEQIGVIVHEKSHGVDEPLPETEYVASCDGIVMDFPQHNEKDASGADEKLQIANGQIHKMEYAASSGRAVLTCPQISNVRKIAAHDENDIGSIQGEEATGGMLYVTEDGTPMPYANSAAGRLDEKRDTCGDREEPSSPPGGKALLYYEALFGKADGQTAEALQGLARRWGDEAVCRAICIALKKGESSVPYIRAVLVHCKGNPRHDTAPSPYERERSMPSGQGGLRHISDRNWGSPDVSLGEGICPVYEALP